METDLNNDQPKKQLMRNPHDGQPKKQLMRNPDDKVFAGVCGGIADYLDANPNIIRLVSFVVLLLPTAGIGPFLYIVLWLFLPTGTQADGRMGTPIVQSRSKRRT